MIKRLIEHAGAAIDVVASSTPGLLAVPGIWAATFVVAPIVLLCAFSVGIYAEFGANPTIGFDHWIQVLHDAVYPKLLWKSILTALVVAVGCVVFAYPVGYFLAFGAGRRRYLLLLALLAPFWTSYVLRILAWRVVLGDEGLINTVAYTLHLRAEGSPIPGLLYSNFSVGLILLYAWIPFAALPIFVGLENLDRSLLEAAHDLGASRLGVLLRVTLPLSRDAILATFLLVFIPSLGEFVAPALVGGNNGYLFGSAIADLFGDSFDWETGSILALFLVGVALVLVGVFGRRLRLASIRF